MIIDSGHANSDQRGRLAHIVLQCGDGVGTAFEASGRCSLRDQSSEGIGPRDCEPTRAASEPQGCLLNSQISPEGRSRLAAPAAGLGSKLALGFIAQAVGVVASLIATPVILRRLGADAYGLVTFSAVLQAWILVFDLGVSAVLARQLSRHHAGALSAVEARSLLAASESVFVASGAIIFATFLLARGWISSHWLGPTSLSPNVVAACLGLIAALLVLRWVSGLYQAALAGLDKQNSVYSIILGGTLSRNIFGVLVATSVPRSAVPYLSVITALTIIEVVICRWLLHRAIYPAKANLRVGWRLLLSDSRFAAALVLSSLVGTGIYQADRLALSHSLSLAEYGLFGLIATICGGISMVVPPFVQSFQPRLTMLLAQNRRADFVHIYRLCIGISFALAIGLAGTIAAKAELVIFVWTGSKDLARHLGPVLRLYAPGAGIAAYLFAPALLQYAYGKMRLHVVGYCLFASIWVPAAIWASWTYGPLGAGRVWLTGNVLYLLFWVPIVHRWLLTAEERRHLDSAIWLRGLAFTALLALALLVPLPELSRIGGLILLGAVCITLTALAAASIRETRQFILSAALGTIDRLSARTS